MEVGPEFKGEGRTEGRERVCLLLLPHWLASGTTWVRQHLCMRLTIFINFDTEVYVGHFLIFGHI